MASSVVEAARCVVCQATIDRARARGLCYTARQEGSGPWVASFMGRPTTRGTAMTLHDAVAAAAAAWSAVEEECRD